MQLQHLPYTPLRITSRFGPRSTGIPGASTYHRGVDIGADWSRPSYRDITAVLPGTVISNYYNSARGWVVLIDHGTIDGRNVKTLYQHLVGAGVPVGRKVKSGDTIGTMGATGVGAQLHLHFEVRLDNAPVNPEPYLRDIKTEEEEMTIRYNKVSELPRGLQEEAQKLIDLGVLKGDAKGNLDVTEDMIRSMIVAKRLAFLA